MNASTRARDAEALWDSADAVADRACPAAMPAHSALLHSDGTRARIAIDLALRAAPRYELARLLDTSLSVGLAPHTYFSGATLGHAASGQLGVTLPPLIDPATTESP